MDYLFNRQGKHIANFVNGQLYAPRGKNVGHYLERQNIFIDMHGRYLGEITQKNRLMYDKMSAYRNHNFGNLGNYGNIGNYGNPGQAGSMGMAGRFRDVEVTW